MIMREQIAMESNKKPTGNLHPIRVLFTKNTGAFSAPVVDLVLPFLHNTQVSLFHSNRKPIFL
jgi:hypothetical protein